MHFLYGAFNAIKVDFAWSGWIGSPLSLKGLRTSERVRMKQRQILSSLYYCSQSLLPIKKQPRKAVLNHFLNILRFLLNWLGPSKKGAKRSFWIVPFDSKMLHCKNSTSPVFRQKNAISLSKIEFLSKILFFQGFRFLAALKRSWYHDFKIRWSCGIDFRQESYN